MREYWLPAAMSSELEGGRRAGAPPAARRAVDRVPRQRGPGRRHGPSLPASLRLACSSGATRRTGIRCVYHGWKYDVEGNCVDTPNLAGNPDFKNRIKAKAYQTVERNGLVWVYMGARKKAPPLPQIEATLLPETEVTINFVQRECNWLQALEGDIDTSHFGFLHAGGVDPDDVPDDSLFRFTVTNRAPDYHVADTECGTMYAAYREATPGRTYWRFANFMLPFWTQTPQGKFTEHLHNRAWVPMDDTHTMFVSLMWRQHPPSIGPDRQGRMMPGFKRQFDYLPNTIRLARPLAPQGPAASTTGWSTARRKRAAATIPASTASTPRTRR